MDRVYVEPQLPRGAEGGLALLAGQLALSPGLGVRSSVSTELLGLLEGLPTERAEPGLGVLVLGAGRVSPVRLCQ